MTRASDTTDGPGTGCPHCGNPGPALPEGTDDDGQTWFAAGEIRVDNTGHWGPTVYVRAVETTSKGLRAEAMEMLAAARAVELATRNRR
mgnify:CR=1 FL=1